MTGEAPLVNPENPNTATTLNAPALENLPNPGGDMTYPLQFAPGALMNTAGSGNDFVGGTNGYGNVQFNGLPALANGYIVDGLETNDPLTNLNSGLSTNLVLGLNSIAEVTVNTLSYTVDQGRYGASQVNYVTKSGTNQFHGNLYELWNGSRFNAADFFTNATPGNHKPRSTVNHFGGSLGGPIAADKLFFFFDSEWVRIALPIVTATTVPTPAFQNYVLQQLPAGRHGRRSPAPVTSRRRNWCRSIRRCSACTGTRPERRWRFWAARSTATEARRRALLPNGNGCANRQSVSHSSDDHEQVQTARIDYNIDEKNITWYRFQADTGLQAAYTDPINPAVRRVSPQPLYSFAAGYTHIFSPKLVNYFNPAFSWYESLFGPANFQKTLAAFPDRAAGQRRERAVHHPRRPGQHLGARAARHPLLHQRQPGLDRGRARTALRNQHPHLPAERLRFRRRHGPAGHLHHAAAVHLRRGFHRIRNVSAGRFQPYNFLNLDLYAQDTWKVTSQVSPGRSASAPLTIPIR